MRSEHLHSFAVGCTLLCSPRNQISSEIGETQVGLGAGELIGTAIASRCTIVKG